MTHPTPENTLDPFTRRRLKRFIEDFRTRTGQLPTLRDFDEAGMPRSLVEGARKAGLIGEFYVTLTSGTIVKGYKITED